MYPLTLFILILINIHTKDRRTQSTPRFYLECWDFSLREESLDRNSEPDSEPQSLGAEKLDSVSPFSEATKYFAWEKMKKWIIK